MQNIRPSSTRIVQFFRMHYTQAVVNEILRYVTFAPIGLPHTASQVVQLKEHTISKASFNS